MRIIPIFEVPDGNNCDGCLQLEADQGNDEIFTTFNCALFNCHIDLQLSKCVGCIESKVVDDA